jgi:hypothetical protein
MYLQKVKSNKTWHLEEKSRIRIRKSVERIRTKMSRIHNTDESIYENDNLQLNK